MKKFLVAAAGLVGILITGCDSSSTTTSKSGQFQGPSTVSTPDGGVQQSVDGQSAQGAGVLMPSGAPPEAKETMQKMMGNNMPKSGGAGAGTSGGAPPSQPPAGKQ